MKRFLFSVILYGSCLLITLPDICLSAEMQVPELENSENFQLVKLHYTNSSGERAVTEFEYDTDGNLLASAWRLLSGERSSDNQYVLDHKGLMVEKRRIFSDSITTKQIFQYNRCRRLLKETYTCSDGREGEVVYTYNDHGKLLEADCHNLNGWFTGKILYDYNAYDVLYHADILKEDKIIGEIIYEYDINGNLRMEKWDFKGTWQQTFVYDFVRSPNS